MHEAVEFPYDLPRKLGRAMMMAVTVDLAGLPPAARAGGRAEREAAVAGLCERNDLRLIYNAAIERILYDGRRYLHPAGLPGMRDRTLTVGSVSKEYRMIGGRVGWVVGPAAVLADVARVGIYNVVKGGRHRAARRAGGADGRR